MTSLAERIARAIAADQGEAYAEYKSEYDSYARVAVSVIALSYDAKDKQIAALGAERDVALRLLKMSRRATALGGMELRALKAEAELAHIKARTEAGDTEIEIEIDRLRLAAFKSNSEADRDAYFRAASKWFQDRHYRRFDAL